MRPLHRAIQLAIICSNATALAPTKFKAVLVGDALLAGRVERSTYEPVRDAAAASLGRVLLSNYEVVCAAADGAGARDLERQLARELSRDPPPDAAVLLAGTNDLWKRDAQRTADRIKRQYAHARSAGVNIVIGVTLPPYELPARFPRVFDIEAGVEATRLALNEEIRASAPALVDLDRLCAADPATYARPDGVHFTRDGYRALGAEIATRLEEALRAPPK